MAASGARVIKERLRRIARNVRAEITIELDQVADDLLERANGLAPQLSGDLILSGAIARRGSRDVVSRTVFYDQPYAVVRHEDFYNLGPISSLKRSPDGPIGRKYLERPFVAQRDNYQERLGRAVSRALVFGVR